MILRKCIVVPTVVVALLGASVNQSKAAPPPAPPPVYTSTAALSTGAAITVGFLGFVAALCIYDVWLKYMGYKNWDGSPKVVQVHHH